MKERALKLLEGEIYCVLSTVDKNGKPESAFVGFSVNDKFEVMIGTSKKSRKYQNIMNNPNVSIVFCFDGKNTIQYEGVGRAIGEGEYDERIKHHYIKNPGAEKYESDPTNTYFVIEPSWLRISVSGPEVVGEVRFER